MAIEDKYGQALQRWFEENATEHGQTAHAAREAIGCSRQRVYQWLATSAVDLVEVGRSSRGAAEYRYVPGSKGRLSVGPGMRPATMSVGGGMLGEFVGQMLHVVSLKVGDHGLVLDCMTNDGRHVELVPANA